MGIPKGPELLIIIVVLLLLFGARKIPELARSLGQATKALREGMEDEEDVNESLHGHNTDPEAGQNIDDPASR